MHPLAEPGYVLFLSDDVKQVLLIDDVIAVRYDDLAVSGNAYDQEVRLQRAEFDEVFVYGLRHL